MCLQGVKNWKKNTICFSFSNFFFLGGNSNAPTKDWKMDYMYVPSRYLKQSLSLIFATNILQTNTADRTFLSIGLGAGAVNGFIHEKLKDVYKIYKFFFFFFATLILD